MATNKTQAEHASKTNLTCQIWKNAEVLTDAFKLSEIIKRIHSLLTGKHSDLESEGWFTAIVGNKVSDDCIITQAKANQSEERFTNGDFRSALAQAAIKTLTSHKSMLEQMLQDPKVFDEVADAILSEIYKRVRSSISFSI